MKYRSFSKFHLLFGGLVLVLLAGFLVVLPTFSQQTQLQTKSLTTVRGDLTIKIVQCPKNVVNAGEELGNGFQVKAKSTFPGAVNGVVVDFILTTNPVYPVPAPYAVYSANYSDNVLLKGGRENISFAGPGVINVPLNGTNQIPIDTPPGIYYLGAVVDAGNTKVEASENNNVHFCKLTVRGTSTPPTKMPDLIITDLAFQKVKSGIDSQGQTYWIFNIIIKVKNQGATPAGAFKVLLERKIGPGGTFITACPTCILDVVGLAAGATVDLPPRQFNNANGMNSTFRATADFTTVVLESNELNNARVEAFIP